MTPPLFFYGTLRHLPLLEIVLGRSLDTIQLTEEVLANYTACAAAEGPFPTLIATKGGYAQGVLVRGLTAEDIARLDYYEGGFDYDLIDVQVESGEAAQVYICAPDRWTATKPWDLDKWAADWAEMSCHAAVEVMGHYGQRSRDEVADIFGQIRGRAWSKTLGGQTDAGQGVFGGKIEITGKRRAYTGYFAVDEVSLRHERFDGSLSPELARSYFIAGDAALVLPFDPVRDRVLVVEQMRMGPLGRGDPEVWHLEPVAGRIDPGETAEQAARREASEEAGLELRALETVARGYPSPGDSTGYFHIFVGVTDLPDGCAGIGGLDGEHEDIRSRLISFDEFLAMADRQAIANTPLTLLAYWLARHRSRLRS
ncbi:NUDIX domain-containing protein [Sulfitobacter sp. F26169L]|uniref:NUDIX domain-containing protein n=1 Tax=Sulfitobacter sp. F26169L TaxID=2996015 RepID=UPI00226091E5|nr:NUDIX domain-containing protein [Sulfitobacter sp. F26169L]MCX7565516.1 NUDIX domain-containing protein [Sulfitobacter sp. F26169L]